MMRGVKKKKIILMICIISILISILGCDPYRHLKPDSSLDKIWICEEPFAYFRWTDGRNAGHIGEIVLEDILYPFVVLFEGHIAYFMANDEHQYIQHLATHLLNARCSFSPDKIVMSVSKNHELYLYNDHYDQLTFHRYDFNPQTDSLPQPPADAVRWEPD